MNSYRRSRQRKITLKKKKENRKKECFFGACYFFCPRFGPVDRCDTRTHTVYLPLPALRSATISHVAVTSPPFHFFSPFRAAVSLLPAASVRAEAWFPGECLPVCLQVLTFLSDNDTLGFIRGIVQKVTAKIKIVVKNALKYN